MTDASKPVTGAPGDRKPVGKGARQALMIVLAALCLTPWATPAVALAAGVVVALAGLGAFEDLGKKWARGLIQASVVLLGLRLPFDKLMETGLGGLAFAAATIIGALGLGWLLGRLLKVEGKVAALLSSGTAICGGSAIGAVGAAIAASSSQMAVAMGTVFLLNGAALYVFPVIGHALGLSEVQFGTWAGVAIHDVSSVVGAARGYHTGVAGSTVAVETATVVKLSRVIWIFPIAMGAAWIWRGRGEEAKPSSTRFPWFVVGFVAASAARTFVPVVRDLAVEHAGAIAYGATAGMTLALFLIGAGLSVKAIKGVGWRALVMGVVLWACLAGASLGVVMGMVE